jgi:O-antigen/teichoic acid export membrane protein
LSVATTFSLFAALGFGAYGLREVSRVRDDPTAVGRLFWELTLLRWGATLLTGAGYALIGWWAGQWRLYATMGLLILATGLDVTWLFQATERFGTSMARHLAVKAATVLLTFLLVRDAGDVVVYALVQMGGTLLSHLWLWFCLPPAARLPRGPLRPLTHLRPSLVYFVPAVATSVYTVLDKTMLGAILGDMSQNGYYESAHKIIRLLLTAVVSLNVVMGVRTSYLFGQSREDEARMHLIDAYRFMCALAFPLCGGVLACGDGFAVAFFGAEFAAAGRMLRLFAPLLVLVGTSNVLGSLYLTPAGYRRRSNHAIIAGAAVNVVLNLWFIPRFGGYGAVVASVAAEGVIAALYLRFTHKFVPARQLLRVAGRYVLYGGAVFAVAWTLSRRMPPTFGAVAVQAAVGAGVYAVLLVVLRDPVWDVWRRLRKGGDDA